MRWCRTMPGPAPLDRLSIGRLTGHPKGPSPPSPRPLSRRPGTSRSGSKASLIELRGPRAHHSRQRTVGISRRYDPSRGEESSPLPPPVNQVHVFESSAIPDKHPGHPRIAKNCWPPMTAFRRNLRFVKMSPLGLPEDGMEAITKVRQPQTRVSLTRKPIDEQDRDHEARDVSTQDFLISGQTLPFPRPTSRSSVWFSCSSTGPSSPSDVFAASKRIPICPSRLSSSIMARPT